MYFISDPRKPHKHRGKFRQPLYRPYSTYIICRDVTR